MLIGASPVLQTGPQGAPAGLRNLPNMVMKDLTIKGIIVGSRRMFEDLIAAMQQHNIKPVIDRVYSFEQVREAIAYMESGDKIGKIVIKIG